jgi:hypothetical protein
MLHNLASPDPHCAHKTAILPQFPAAYLLLHLKKLWHSFLAGMLFRIPTTAQSLRTAETTEKDRDDL